MPNENTISFEKVSRISKIKSCASKICELTKGETRIVGGTLEPEDTHFTLTLVVPKFFNFGTNVAEMMSNLFAVTDGVVMMAHKGATRMTFVVRDVYQKR